MKYVSGEAKPGMYMVIVRGLKMNLPPVLGDTESIRKSKDRVIGRILYIASRKGCCAQEMAFMRSVLGTFAKGCESRVPLYGCSAQLDFRALD